MVAGNSGIEVPREEWVDWLEVDSAGYCTRIRDTTKHFRPGSVRDSTISGQN
jgi:hypothetical protein